jgi:hypothetical protein
MPLIFLFIFRCRFPDAVAIFRHAAIFDAMPIPPCRAIADAAWFVIITPPPLFFFDDAALFCRRCRCLLSLSRAGAKCAFARRAFCAAASVDTPMRAYADLRQAAPCCFAAPARSADAASQHAAPYRREARRHAPFTRFMIFALSAPLMAIIAAMPLLPRCRCADAAIEARHLFHRRLIPCHAFFDYAAYFAADCRRRTCRHARSAAEARLRADAR